MLFTLSAWMAVPGPSVPIGILCPVCQSEKHRIISSQKVVGMLYRKRLCTNGHNFETQETVKP